MSERERTGAEDADAPVERIRRRDELLQVLFWLEGEGFEAEMRPEGMKRFLGWPEERIRLGLDELVADELAVRVGRPDEADAPGSGSVRLTETGRREGGRRFVSEFAPLLARDTHHGGECHDPDCECHELGPAACTTFPRDRE